MNSVVETRARVFDADVANIYAPLGPTNEVPRRQARWYCLPNMTNNIKNETTRIPT